MFANANLWPLCTNVTNNGLFLPNYIEICLEAIGQMWPWPSCITLPKKTSRAFYYECKYPIMFKDYGSNGPLVTDQK